MQSKKIHRGYKEISRRYDTNVRGAMYLAQKGEIPVF
jgi:hypothetical protein